MSAKQKSSKLRLSAKRLSPKQLIVGFIILLALMLLALAGFWFVVDRAARGYGEAATAQKSEIAAHLKRLAELSKQQQDENGDITKLRQATKELNKDIAELKAPKLEKVPLGLQLSQDYRQASKNADKYQDDVGRLQASCLRLVDFAQYHTALQEILGKADLFTTVKDGKTALAREKAWREAAVKLEALETSEAALKSAAQLFGQEADAIADVFKASAAHFKTTDVSKIEADRASIEKKIAKLRADAEVLAAAKHEIQKELTDAIVALH